LEEFQARFEHFEELKPCFTFLVNPFNVNVVGTGITDGGQGGEPPPLGKLNVKTGPPSVDISIFSIL